MDPKGTIQLPPQLSTLAPEVDWVYYFIFWVSTVLFVAITGATVWFVIRYRRRKGVKAAPTGHNTPLELGWTFAPLILLFFLFHWGFEGYMKLSVAPDDALEIRVRGMQWNWEFEHGNGMLEYNELTVPANKPVKLILSSRDVLHSFFVPAFRVKRDVVPGMYTTLWFEATEEGETQVYCAEYCGAPKNSQGNAGHSAMLAKMKVVSATTYEDYLREGPQMPEGLTPEQWGEQLFSKFACNTCHGTDGSTVMQGPNLGGAWGRTEQLAGGGTAVVDENYVRESIMNPTAKIVEGFQPVMPPFPNLPERQMTALMAYLKSLGK